MNKLIIKTHWIVLIVFSLIGINANALTIKAYVDQTVIGLNQQFTLSVELSGDGAQGADPKMPDMGAFASFLGSGSSQNIQIINGRTSISKILTYHYLASEEGKHQIGPVVVEYKGQKLSSDPIDIEIQSVQGGRPTGSSQNQDQSVPKSANDDLFVEAAADKKQVYQNEPVTITYKIYTRVQVSSFGFTKEPETTGFWKEDYNLPQQPATSTEVIQGKRYTVATIKKQALFPMTSGTKKLDPLVITCEVRAQRQSRDIFDDFFNDPFFGRTKQVQVPSNSVTINVLPLPLENKPANFTGAVGRFNIKASVDKNNVKTNEAVTYKVKLEGNGNIHMLPDLNVQFSSDFESYPPKTSETIQRQTAISGSKTYEYVLVPRFPGTQKIDPVVFSYFDPGLKAYQTIRSDVFQIQVAQGEETFSVIPSGATKEEVKWRGKDIRFIKTEAAEFKKINSVFYRTLMFWLIAWIPLMAVCGAMGYRRHLNRMQGDVAYARKRRAGREARRRLAKARSLLKSESQKQFYAEIGKALMGFLGDKLNIAEAGMISQEVRSILEKRHVNKTIIDDVFAILQSCDYQRFAPSDATESDMKEFLKRAERTMSDIDRELKN